MIDTTRIPDPTVTAGPEATDTHAADPGGVVPYLIVTDARAALAWYEAALGARQRGEPLIMDDGRVGHAEFELSGSVLYIADESRESHVMAPRPGEDARVSLTAAVADVDAAVEKARAGGAQLERAPTDHPYGRNAVMRDPFGHRWILSGPAVAREEAPAASPEPARDGDVAYAALWVRDVDRAASFFGAVLGWRFAPDGPGPSRHLAGQSLPHGIVGGQERSTLFLSHCVRDVRSAVDRVRAAGGSAGEPTHEPFGLSAMCTDDQGSRFALHQVDASTPRPAQHGVLEGDLGYVTMEVVDSARMRRFYGAVFGWDFASGRVADGWQPDGVHPMIGIHGGHDVATTVPIYRVDDIRAAVDGVRRLGGTGADPTREPYGLSSVCTDDQGTRFCLWEA